MGLDEKGFKRKRFSDLYSDMETKAKSVYGEKVNLSERSPLGIILRLFAWFLSLFWQQLENVYNSAFVDTASGRSLRNTGKYIGMKEKGAEKAKGSVTVTGVEGTTVKIGTRFATKSGVVFETLADSVIPADGEVDIVIQAISAGSSGNVPSGAINVIVNPSGAIQSVVNQDGTTGGREKETDYEFRQRYDRSVASGGSSTTESVIATVLALPSVRDCIIEENTTMDEVNGVPAKSLAPFVFGGENEEIAEAIRATKAGGIRSWGETVVDVVDSRGNLHKIGFTRPEVIQIYAHVSLETNQDFPLNGKDLIRTAIVQYIGGQDSDGTIYNGVGLGKSVIYTKVISAINQIEGIADVTVQIGTTEQNFTTQNIQLGSRQVAETDWQKVVVS